MPDDAHEDAEEKVAATTAGYGGPVSDEELAEVWLPEGEKEVADVNEAHNDSPERPGTAAGADNGGSADTASAVSSENPDPAGNHEVGTDGDEPSNADRTSGTAAGTADDSPDGAEPPD